MSGDIIVVGRAGEVRRSQVSMLWYDGDKTRSLADKVRRGAEYFNQKYGAVATLCYVNPDLVNGKSVVVDGIKLIPSKVVLRSHFSFRAGEAEEKK